MSQPKFGGQWTEVKLSLLERYLVEYSKIFTRNERARWYDTFYVDAFAGAGTIDTGRHTGEQYPNQIAFGPESELDAGSIQERAEYLEGSVRKALGVDPPFKNYLFIEQNRNRCSQLENLRSEYPDRNIVIVNQDANSYLRHWCSTTDWMRTRAVLFLDPFGMEVEWETLRIVADTQAIDLWLWFPIGGIVRHLTTRTPPPPDWSRRITRSLGTEEWLDRFYPVVRDQNLFGETDIRIKDADVEMLSGFITERLASIFAGVAPNPRLFRNSRNSPLYLFCFATGAQKATARAAAIRIANHLLTRG